MDIYDMVQHLIPKLRNKTLFKINNLGHMMQNWTSIVESNWIFSKLYILIYIYILNSLVFVHNNSLEWIFMIWSHI